ncbi:MAG: LamG-like jellyroll fold domain-containing protein [Verrucomicrobiota bacterium]
MLPTVIRLFGVLASLATPALSQMARDPKTNLVVPSVGQLAWHEDEIAVFYHMNPTFPVGNMTFANFDPVAIVNAAESIGAKHIVVVAKHVNGFCWWPTKATKPGDTVNTLNIALSQYKNGGGDVIREIFTEARKRGIRPGVYLGTRDDHFGAGEKGAYPANQQAYNDYYITQATEIATQYGDLAEWWLDGTAVASLGAEISNMLATHQPNAAVFQGTSATLRWVGNENGTAPYPSWNTISQSVWDSIQATSSSVTPGDPDGVRWVPAEVDTHLSTGWFNGGPRSLPDLMNVYYKSVGHGVGLLLNFPVQTDGTILPTNLARGIELGNAIDDAVGHSLFTTGPVDGSTVTLDFTAATEIDHVIVEEDLRYGERVRAFHIDGWNGSEWVPVLANGSAIGRKQIRKFTPATYSKVRLSITNAVGTPKIRSLAVTRTGAEPPDTTPPSTPAGLKATVAEDKVTLKWQPATDPDSEVRHYRVYRNDSLIGTMAQTEFRDVGARENQAYSYRVSAVNGSEVEGEKSAPVPATTGTDRTPPLVLSATTLPGRNSLSLLFNEPVSPGGAAKAANYRISHGHSVNAAIFDPKQPDRVSLTLGAPLAPETLYTLKVGGITDDANARNPIAAETKTTFGINTYGLTRHWKLDETAGTTALDSVAGKTAPKNNAQITGATWTAQGRRNGALSFDGNDSADGGTAGFQTNFTLALWVRPSSAAGTQMFVAKERSGQEAYQQRLYLANGKPGFLMTNESGQDFGLYPFESDSALPLNAWSHVAVTNDGDVFKLFINGVLAKTKQTTGIIQSPYNPANLLLGAAWNSDMTAKIGFFTGQMDDVRIYSDPLPPAEIQRVVAEAQGPGKQP